MTISSLILDGIVAVLLVVTIGYAMILNRKIAGLRRDRAALEKLAGTFVESTSRAGNHLTELHKTADDLRAEIKEAISLRDDLAFLVDRGGRVADGLETAVRGKRNASGAEDALEDMVAVSPRAKGKKEPAKAAVHDIGAARRRGATPAERAALRAGVGADADARSRVQAPAPAQAPAQARAQAPAQARPEPRRAAGEGPRGLEPRSEAERNLLRALRAAR